MLSFDVGGQTFGINVFKVKEIVHIKAGEKFPLLPHSHQFIEGVKHIREQVVPVVNTPRAISVPTTSGGSKFLLIVELSGQISGFLVDKVNKIEHVQWENVVPAPISLGGKSYITSVAKLEDRTISMLDVEKILGEIEGESDHSISQNLVGKGRSVLVVDDSKVAYNQVARCAHALGFETYRCSDGKYALEHLISMVESGIDVSSHYPLIIVDIEMPRMDGYKLTSEIRSNASLSGLRIMINSSLSSNVSKETAYAVGADIFLSKFNPLEIQSALVQSLQSDSAQAA